MKILIISGFLGAGKTTFIKALQRHTQKEYVILENEYGDADIDTAVLQRDNMKVWELTEGCICCSVKADFANSVLTISNTLDPDYLIVEPSGVGMLSNIYTNIKKIQYARIRLLAPITLIDFHSFQEYMDTFDAFYKDQIINAGRVLIAKGEKAPGLVILTMAVTFYLMYRAMSQLENVYADSSDAIAIGIIAGGVNHFRMFYSVFILYGVMVMTITFFQAIGDGKKAGKIVMLRQLILLLRSLLILWDWNADHK